MSITPSSVQTQSPALSLPALEKLAHAKAAGKVDTISSAKQAALKAAVKDVERPKLPPAQPQNQQVLTTLAAAFVKIFQTMGESAITAQEVVASDQRNNVNNSNVVLRSTTLQINKQNQAIKHYQHIQAEQKKWGPILKFLSIVFSVLMVVVIAATVISGVVTGGASESALPEEFELMAGGDSAIEGAADSAGGVLTDIVTDAGAGASEAAADDAPMEFSTRTLSEAMGGTNDALSSAITETVGEAATSGITEAASAATDATVDGLGDSLGETVGDQAKEAAQALRKEADDLAVKGAKKGMKRGMKFLIGAVGSGMFATPTLVSGIESTQLATMYNDQANLLRQTGEASGQQSLASNIFRVFQQGTKQSINVATQEIQGATDVYSTFSDVLAAFQHISTGAAQAAHTSV